MVGSFPGGEKSRDVSIIAPAIVAAADRKGEKMYRGPLENPLGFRKKNPTVLTVGVVKKKNTSIMKIKRVYGGEETRCYFFCRKSWRFISLLPIYPIYHIPAGAMSTHIVPALYHVCCRTLFSSGRNLAVFPKKFSAAISFYFFTSLMSCFVGKVGAFHKSDDSKINV